jgi:hypothetical protein
MKPAITGIDLLRKVYDRYYGIRAEAAQQEFENMNNRKSERLGPQVHVLHYSYPKESSEAERIAMKEFAEEVYPLLTSEDPVKENEGVILSKLFFANYAKQNHPGNRGRGWSDAELALWQNWIRNGMPEGEWHFYMYVNNEQIG